MHDQRNPAFIRRANDDTDALGLWPFLNQFVPDYRKQDIGAISIQQVVKAVDASGRHDDWVREFKAKYGLFKG